MSYFKGEDLNSSERFVYIYGGGSHNEIEQAVDALMISRGYKHLGKGVYEYGSRTARLLLGGFYKYFKFKVTSDASDPNGIKIGIKKESTGMSGGLLGVKRMNTEFSNLKKAFYQI